MYSTLDTLVVLIFSSLRRFCSTDLYIITAHAYGGFYSSKIKLCVFVLLGHGF
ncbi:unnamed protein product [Brassica rapa subsp. narinosa]